MTFLKQLLWGIPLGIGLVLTLLSAVYAVNALEASDNATVAFFLAVTGVPLLLASGVAIRKRLEG